MLNKNFNPIRSFLTALAVGLPLGALGGSNDIVRVAGESTEYASKIGALTPGSDFGSVELDKKKLCARTESFLEDFLEELHGGSAEIIDSPCDELKNDSQNKFTIYYTTCSMLMIQGDGKAMRWSVPPGGADARMDFLDFQTLQHVDMSVNLDKDLRQLSGQGPQPQPSVLGRDLTQGSGLTATGNSGQRLGFDVHEHRIDHVGDIAPAGLQGVPAGMVPAIKVTGTAWIAPNATGADVIRSFYGNFESRLERASGTQSFMASLVRQMGALSKKGVPMEVDQVTSMIMPNGGLGMLPAQTSRSKSRVTAIDAFPYDGSVPYAEALCAPTAVPEGFTQVAMPGGGAPAGSDAAAGQASMTEAQKQMQDARTQMQEAMKGLTPEERRQMEALGLDKMFGGGQ
jgi:hypothetical protein